MTSKAGYWIGGGLMVAAVAGAVLWAVLSFGQVVSKIDDFERVAIPGTKQVRLEARKYVLYIEGPGADATTPEVEAAIFDPRTDGALALATYNGSLTYSFDTSGSAVATVEPPRTGVYEVRVGGLGQTSSPFTLALGESIGSKLVSAIVGAFAIGGILGVAGLALLIVTGIRRNRRSRPPAQNWAPPAAP